MVRRFRRIIRYPGSIPPDMSAHQSPVPSQNVETPLPYDPILIPDMHRVPPQGDTFQGSDIRAVYDSRFQNSFDFYWTDYWRNSLNQFGGFNVPLGYNAVIRKITIEMFQSGSNPVLDGNPFQFLSPWAGPDIFSDLSNMPTLVMLLDGVSAPTWTPTNFTNSFVPPLTGGVPIPDLLVHSIELDSFILAGEGQNFQISVLPFTLFDNTQPQRATQIDIIAHYYGNLILSTGRQLVEEIGNGTPQPVQIKGNTL